MIVFPDIDTEVRGFRLEVRTTRSACETREHPEAVSDRGIAAEGEQATFGGGHGRAGDGGWIYIRRLQEGKHLIPLQGLGKFTDDRVTHSTTDQMRTSVLFGSLAEAEAHAQGANDEAAVSMQGTPYNETYDP